MLTFKDKAIHIHGLFHAHVPESNLPTLCNTTTSIVATIFTRTYCNTPYLQFIMNGRPMGHSMQTKRKGMECLP